MQRQLGAGERAPGSASIAARNRDLRAVLLDILTGERPSPEGLGDGATCPSEQKQMRLAGGAEINL